MKYNKYKVKFMVPELTGKEVHEATIIDHSLDDTWTHVDILDKVYDLNVWIDDSPVSAALYPTVLKENGCYSTDTMEPMKVCLLEIVQKRFLRNKKIDLTKVIRNYYGGTE